MHDIGNKAAVILSGSGEAERRSPPRCRRSSGQIKSGGRRWRAQRTPSPADGPNDSQFFNHPCKHLPPPRFPAKILSDPGDHGIFQLHSLVRESDPQTADRRLCRCSAKELRGDIGLDLLDSSALQRRPVQRAAALQQYAVDVLSAQPLHQGRQIHMAFPCPAGSRPGSRLSHRVRVSTRRRRRWPGWWGPPGLCGRSCCPKASAAGCHK